MSSSSVSEKTSAKAHSSAPQSERRDWVRFPSDLEAICWAPGNHDVDAFGGVVRDISAGGIGLVCRDEPLLGCQVRIKLHSHYVNLLKSLDATVVSITAVGRGEYLVGCQFDRELNQNERRHML
jgi:c-di-GMP-binding flagellar brake protein YcgR